MYLKVCNKSMCICLHICMYMYALNVCLCSPFLHKWQYIILEAYYPFILEDQNMLLKNNFHGLTVSHTCETWSIFKILTLF